MAMRTKRLRHYLDEWKSKAQAARDERERQAAAEDRQAEHDSELAEYKATPRDPVEDAMVLAVYEAEASSLRMHSEAEAAMRRIQKKCDVVWQECERTLQAATDLHALIELRDIEETRAARVRESGILAFRVVQWRDDPEAEDSDVHQALQIFSNGEWRDVPVVNVPPPPSHWLRLVPKKEQQ